MATEFALRAIQPARPTPPGPPPQVAALLKYIDEMPIVRRVTVRSFIISLCGVAGYFYYVHIYCLPKLEYNQVHPYTSWIPITLWIILRNMTPWLRIHHLRLYGWLGCVTLETYISQVRTGSCKEGSWCRAVHQPDLEQATDGRARTNARGGLGWGRPHRACADWCCCSCSFCLLQFHIWMKTVIPDGQPKSLLVFIPGYPLLNFALVSACEFLYRTHVA